MCAHGWFVFFKAFHGVNHTRPNRGAVFLFSKAYGAVRCGSYFFESYDAVPCDFDIIIILNYGPIRFFSFRCGAMRFSFFNYQSHTAVRHLSLIHI